ncbi:MAG: SAM-dependent methyltransferase [Rhodocyclaceae bacterium]|nr:SAM-dependent methyltransferase [Rhodocyclaceae bacterium]MBX3668357.1 SAM-dependent methyltransferase [Rhodocyclaceae bacterium]
MIPAALGAAPWQATLPAVARAEIHRIEYFVVENAKSARAELKRLDHPIPLQQLRIAEMPRDMDIAACRHLLEAAAPADRTGVLSEAGCPGVADPGALLARAAHEMGWQVRPLVGPSSILLALMASGLDGQHFAFHGYLPVDEGARRHKLLELEAQSRRERRTQLFIETPYRNRKMFDALIAACAPDSLLCVAADLTMASEFVRTQTIAAWRKSDAPDLDKRPAIFALLAQARSRTAR